MLGREDGSDVTCVTRWFGRPVGKAVPRLTATRRFTVKGGDAEDI